MQIKSTIFENVLIDVKGDYDTPDETTGYKGGWKTCKVYVGYSDITNWLTESTLEQIDEQIAIEL